MRLLAAAVLLAAMPAYAQMYKCVDGRGVTHYSDKPQPGCKGGPVDIRGSPPISGKPPVDEKAEAAKKAALEQHCASLRQQHAAMSGVARMHMDEVTREARLAALNEQMRECP